jgi:hypothetical protein
MNYDMLDSYLRRLFKKSSLFFHVETIPSASTLDFPIGAFDSIQSSVKPEHSKTPSFPQNVLGNCGT